MANLARAVSPDDYPDPTGHFGPFGGRIVPETLIRPLEELTETYHHCPDDAEFQSAPTTSPERQRMIGAHGSDFAYYVSLKGVTGAASMDVDAVAARIEEMRRHTALPLGVGFGISTPETAARVAAIADAVVVGSALVKRVEFHRHEPPRMRQEVGALIDSMRRAIDSVAAA